jgi:hypothetical protein
MALNKFLSCFSNRATSLRPLLRMVENKLFGSSGSLAGPLASSANKQKIILFKKCATVCGSCLRCCSCHARSPISFAACSVMPVRVRSGLNLSGSLNSQPSFFHILRRANIGQRDGVNFRRRASEMCVDLNREPITDDEQRRIIECQCIGH